MRADKFTVKTREALVEAQEIANRKGQAELLPEHVLSALLAQQGGVASALLSKLAARGDAALANPAQIA